MQMVNEMFSRYLIYSEPSHEDKWGTGGIAPPIFASAVNGSVRSTSRPGRFTPGTTAPRNH